MCCREYGDIGRIENYQPYKIGMLGNLSFVRRLTCVGKLEAHTGCVNALNFNQSGIYLFVFSPSSDSNHNIK